MGIKNVSGSTWVTCVAVAFGVVIIAMAISKCSAEDDSPKAVAGAEKQSPPVQVYPERGDLVAVKVKQGNFLCGAYDGIKTEQVMLPNSGGTASYNGTLISTEYTAETVAVSIDGQSHFVSGWVTASDGGVAAFNVVNGESSTGIMLDMRDFDAYVKDVKDITLCSLG
jgi:hypothetical protein